MPTKQILKEKEAVNAIDYIKNSAIFTAPRYQWLNKLISKTFDDYVHEEDIVNLINSFFPNKEVKDDLSSGQRPDTEQIESDGEDKDICIDKIKSIDKISNIGLLDIDSPLELKEGLNVFYGKNGAGKSSIYLGLCKVLGKNKKIYSNISKEKSESCCKITFESTGKDYPLEWNSPSENKEVKVMIFDSQISNFIVEQDQENQFKMAHLKMECFDFLYNLYQRVGDRLNLKLTGLETERNALGQVLSEKVSSVFEEDFTWDEETIKNLNFKKEDGEKLEKLEGQAKVLEKNNTEAVVRNIYNAKEEVENVLSVFGESDEKWSDSGEIEHAWKLKYDRAIFEKFNKQIETYDATKKAFEKSGKNKISSLIPPEWINESTWENFISSSIDFLNSLDTKSKKDADDICIYCRQPLETKEAKLLINAYRELNDEHRDKIEEELKKIKVISEEMDGCIRFTVEIATKNKKIETEFKAINRKEPISFDFANILKILQKYKNSIANTKEIKIKDEDIEKIKRFWDVYYDIFIEFEEAINKLNKDIAGKDAKLVELYGAIKLLKSKKSLCENKNNLLKYLRLNTASDILREKALDLTSLKQATSSLKTDFSDKATLKEFKNCLNDEYEFFKFKPPENWSIAPATRGGVNKRVYSIKDRRLGDIFSEGERKLHSLSDFFAQSKLDGYNGVFILDDPVNSLDEDNIENVAERINKLVENGNQVIVFTHNIYFLYSIIKNQNLKINKVERINNQINLIKEVSIGETQELKDRLREVDSRMDKLSKEKPEDITEYELSDIYNLMSGYLEDYVEKIYFKNIVSRFRRHIRIQGLRDIKNLDTSIIDNFLKLYEHTSARGSRHSQPSGVKKPNYSELIKDVEDLKTNYKFA